MLKVNTISTSLKCISISRSISLHWKPKIQLSSIPKYLQTQVKDKTSLTAKLRKTCGLFQVVLLSEGYSLPLASEAKCLGIGLQQKVWTRCVVLKCDKRVVVYARTIIPNFNYSNPWYSIRKLGTQPLGELLFKHKNLIRSEFEFLRTDNFWSEYLPESIVYTSARRCVFTHLQSPLLLTEVFIENDN